LTEVLGPKNSSLVTFAHISAIRFLASGAEIMERMQEYKGETKAGQEEAREVPGTRATREQDLARLLRLLYMA